MANQVAVSEKSITDDVLSRVNQLKEKNELLTPTHYSPENALKSAYLILSETLDKNKKLVLQSCTKSSIANTLLDMVIQGLSPAKKQCYFVAYGNRLQLMRSYMGTVAVTKRLKEVKDVKAYCIYEGDEFETTFDLDTATIKVTKFNPKFKNIDIKNINGAFAVIVGYEGVLHTEIMSMAQIRNSWNQGQAKGKSMAHENFTEEMAKKTVISRACKLFANTSDDSDLLIEAFNNTDREINTTEETDKEVTQEIEEKANSKELDFEDEDVVDADYKEIKEEKEEPQQATFEEPLF
jgi:recombination protein RecT